MFLEGCCGSSIVLGAVLKYVTAVVSDSCTLRLNTATVAVVHHPANQNARKKLYLLSDLNKVSSCTCMFYPLWIGSLYRALYRYSTGNIVKTYSSFPSRKGLVRLGNNLAPRTINCLLLLWRACLRLQRNEPPHHFRLLRCRSRQWCCRSICLVWVGVRLSLSFQKLDLKTLRKFEI